MDVSPATDITAAKEQRSERRRHHRAGVMMMATLRAGRGFFDCMVLDLSVGGAKLTFGEEIVLAPGDPVALIIARIGTFRAQSVWQRASFTGIRFLDPPEAIALALGDLLPS
jgi:hypothetical protein